MDSELLKDKDSDIILTQKLPKCSELLLYLRCASFKHSNDPLIMKIKEILKTVLKPVVDSSPLPMNIPLASLNFMLRSIYYACTTPPSPPLDILNKLTDVISEWNNTCLLGLAGDEEARFASLVNEFALIYSYIFLPITSTGVSHGFVCPMCVLNTVYTDIGWTDLICPRPEGSSGIFQREISQRGSDKGYPVGYCRHLISYHKTYFDNILHAERVKDGGLFNVA